MLYLRKINPDAWEGKQRDDSDSISDIATKNHELSVWEIKDIADIPSIALALAMTLSEPRPFMGVLLDSEEIKSSYGWDINVRSNPGSTMYSARRNDHKDFILLNVADMTMMADYIHNIVNSGNTKRIFAFDEIMLTEEAINKYKTKEISEKDILEAKNKGGKWGKMYRDLTKHQ